MLEEVPKWSTGDKKSDYGYGKSLLFPGLPWGEPGTCPLVPTIPDFVQTYDEPNEPQRRVLGTEVIEGIDESKKSTLQRYGHFSALFDQEMPDDASMVDSESAKTNLARCMRSWKVADAITRFRSKSKFVPEKGSERGVFSLRCSSKNLALATYQVGEEARVYIWREVLKKWEKTSIALHGNFGIAVSRDSRFIATSEKEVISCWEIAPTEVKQIWSSKVAPNEEFDRLNNHVIAVSSDYVVFEYPKSMIQTFRTKDGTYHSTVVSAPSVSSIALCYDRLLVGGITNMYQIFRLHKGLWFSQQFQTVDTFKLADRTLAMPLDIFTQCRISGNKIALLSETFLLTYDNDPVRPIARLFPAVACVAVEILGDYLLTLERVSKELFRFSMVEFVSGKLVQSTDITPTREESESDRSLILATATEIYIMLFDATIYRFTTNLKPLEFKWARNLRI